eukprot:206567-Amphidinium_carterae.1
MPEYRCQLNTVLASMKLLLCLARMAQRQVCFETSSNVQSYKDDTCTHDGSLQCARRLVGLEH